MSNTENRISTLERRQARQSVTLAEHGSTLNSITRSFRLAGLIGIVFAATLVLINLGVI